MATIIEGEAPATNRTLLVDNTDSGAGWAVAVVVLVLVVLGGAFWYMRYYRPVMQSAAPGATVQVNLPAAGYAPAPSSNTSGGATTPAAPAGSNTQ